MSVTHLAIADTRTTQRIVDPFSNRFLYSVFSGGAFSHHRFAYLAVRPAFSSSAGLSRFPRSPS
jgi:hypothetical protein